MFYWLKERDQAISGIISYAHKTINFAEIDVNFDASVSINAQEPIFTIGAARRCR